MLDLPIEQNSSHFRFRTELDGATYTFEFRWNDRWDAWLMSIGDAEGNPVASGVRVVINMPLVSHLSDPRLPPGVLMAIDTTGQNLDAGYQDLGRRVPLMYTTAAEVIERYGPAV